MAHAVAAGCIEAGLPVTLLPVLYERAGFDAPTLRRDQRRFAADAAFVRRAFDDLRGSGAASVRAGIAIHSLRAAAPGSIRALAAGFEGVDCPIHVHVAEQEAEVVQCLAATGRRPIEWLLHEGLLDARWQLVHATHATPSEIEGVAASGAGIVICPSTEMNLGDGIPDLPRWLAAGVPIAIGSDSHVVRSAAEELRWLEGVQRLVHRRRNVAAAPEAGEAGSAGRLFGRVVEGGARAAGSATAGLRVGARADLLVLDPTAPPLLGVPPPAWLAALCFTGGAGPGVRHVLAAGHWVVRGGHHPHEAAIAARYAAAVGALLERAAIG
jgi:formimidoylglutamate deiminase